MKRLRGLIAPLSAICAAMTVMALIVIVLSDKPGQALTYLFAGPLSNPLALGETLATSARLSIAGLAAALAFRSGLFNLGGEGQALSGGLAGAAIALALPNLPPLLAPLMAVLAGMTTGALIGALSGILKARWNADELISTFLISAAIGPVGHVILSDKMHDPGSYLIGAPPLPEAYRLSSWLPPSRFGPVFIWAAVVLILLWLFLGYTRQGYEWKLRGASESFARYGGIRTGIIAISSLSVSGALYGLAGTAALLDSGQAVQGFTGGLGWDGLAVALIAASRPEWIPLAALAYAWIAEGTRSAMLHTGFPYALGGVVQGIVFLLVTARFVFKRRKSMRSMHD